MAPRVTTKRLERRRADLRDARDKLEQVHVPKGEVRGLLKRLRRRVREAIDRLTIRIRKRRRRDRIQPSVVYERISPNRSSRLGVSPRLIVLHDTESHEQAGNADLVAIANYFASSSAQASSHVITDGDGHSARCVPDAEKAWTQVAFNSVSLSIEQIGFATYSREDWSDKQLMETARWIARWHRVFDIPLQRGAVSGASVTRPGIVTHEQLGSAGGGHHDPGDGYPVEHVIALAARLAR